MCGICGIFNFDLSNSVVSDTLRRMSQVLYHRGPDDEGILVNGNIGLAMRRLSIIDLDRGNQPISNEDKTIWIVFNGEIYNFQELRRELIEKGHTFRTKTDTETIVHAYEEYGTRCVDRLNGMFAFAIWDKSKNTLLLARDRVGKKPLYYFLGDNSIIFASEIKSILQNDGIDRTVDLGAVDLFLTYEYIPAPRSIFARIKKLPPGHILTLDNSKCTIEPYWDIILEEDDSPVDVRYEERLIELLEDSVRLRLLSDVPLGAFLSGGIDSSAIVAMMSRVSSQPIKTFSIGFDDASYNELGYARRVAELFKTDHREEIIKPDIVNLTERLIYFFDEPLADTSIFPTYLVSKLASEDVKVILSGDGGDEIFAGYDTYIADKIERIFYLLPHYLREKVIKKIATILPPSPKKKGLLNKAKRFLEGASLPPHLQHVRWMTYLSEEEKQRLYSREFMDSILKDRAYKWIGYYFDKVASFEPLRQQQYVDIKTFLVDDIMVKVDRMTMANSLEARAPLLDHRLIEFALKLPSHLKLKGFKSKYIFKKALRKHLPDDILRRKKEGFSSPVKRWLQKELKPVMLDLLSPVNIKRRGYFNPAYIEKMIREHIEGKENHAHRLWPIMVLELWHQQYVDREFIDPQKSLSLKSA